MKYFDLRHYSKAKMISIQQNLNNTFLAQFKLQAKNINKTKKIKYSLCLVRTH